MSNKKDKFGGISVKSTKKEHHFCYEQKKEHYFCCEQKKEHH